MVRLRAGRGIRVSHEARRAYHPIMKIVFRLVPLLGGCLVAGAAAAQEAWPVAGQQGLVRYVIVPLALEKDAAAYQQQIGRLCEPERTCFLNFYTNRDGAEVVVPLPDAITAQATATFRRSTKNGAERFQWSCRMQMPQQACF